MSTKNDSLNVDHAREGLRAEGDSVKAALDAQVRGERVDEGSALKLVPTVEFTDQAALWKACLEA